MNGDVQVPGVKVGEQFHATGWVPYPEAAEKFEARLRAEGRAVTFEEAAPRILARFAGADSPRFYWDSERAVLGRVLASWDQKQVGACVGFGYGRAVQDVMLNEIADGEPEKYPGTEVCPEVIYGGSRVEVGQGRLAGSDGSVGAWASQWVKDWGVVARGRYGALDVREYDETTCRRLGDRGVPDDVEALARVHPITEVARLTTADGLWAALGAGKGVPVCSMQGFTMRRDADGFCPRSGSWGHCMVYRGRFVHPTRGRCVLVQNSWGAYLEAAGNRTVRHTADDGTTNTFELPEGCFCVPLAVTQEALNAGDTYVLAGLTGWAADPDPLPPKPPTPGDGWSGTVVYANGAIQSVTPRG